LASGGCLLPQRYRRLVIKAQSSLRYEEFDFSYYNKTRFAGLENDLPNCYCNALLQVCVFCLVFDRREGGGQKGYCFGLDKAIGMRKKWGALNEQGAF
jgi:PAB-dependent poly(A)-specific ribonuclease subunit 2